MEQAITITEDVITIAGHLFVHKDYSITNKELIIDALSVHYNLHTIKIVFFDGENIEFSGAWNRIFSQHTAIQGIGFHVKWNGFLDQTRM